MNTFKNYLWKLVVIAVVLMMVISGMSNAGSVYAVNEKTQQTTNQNETAPQTGEETTQKNAKNGSSGTSFLASENEKVEEKTDAKQTSGQDPPAATETKTDSIEMPEASFTASTKKLTISVTALANTFPKGTKMDVKEISTSDAKSIAKEKLNNIGEVVGVDITFSYEGKEIEPANDKNVTVKMTLKNEMEGKNFQVLHKKDSGVIEKMNADVSGKKAVFKAKSFSIYVFTSEQQVDTYQFYDGNGNIMSTYTQKITASETLEKPNAPEKEGYKFIGWSTNKYATKDDFNFNELPKVTTGATYKIYAVFEEVHYVFFMAGIDDDARVFTTKEGKEGDEVSTTDIKLDLASHQSVTGWYKDKALTDNAGDTIKLGKNNIKLYPKIESGYYITFKTGKNASYIEPKFYGANDRVTDASLPKPKRAGYTFLHWSTSENGDKYATGNTLSDNITLHAVWEANKDTKYTVIYWQENANDTNYSYHQKIEETGVSGSQIDISSIEKSYEGFTLNEDKTNEANKGVTISGDGSTIVNIYYTRKEYSVNFYEFEGYYDWNWNEWRGEWKEMNGLRITAKYGANISKDWPTTTSKIWGTKISGGSGIAPYQSGISTMPLDGASFYYVYKTGNYTMNLHYYLENIDEKGYKLDHTDSFKSNSNKWTTTKEDHYDIAGFTYEGNVEDGTKFEQKSRNVYEVSFKYERNSYSINFVNGDKHTKQTHKYEADISKVDLKTAPERPSGIPSEYNFVGWFDNELREGEPVKLPSKMPAHNITLYAKWAAPKVNVTVHGLDGNEEQEFDVDFSSKIGIDRLPTVKDSTINVILDGNKEYTYTVPIGSNWIGWATKDDKDNYTLYNFDTELRKDLNLYPYVIDSSKYVVSYNVGDGKGEVTDDKKYAKGSYADVKSAKDIKAPEDTMFLNWQVYEVTDNEQTDTKTYLYPGDKLKMTSNMLLVANYVPIPQKVSLVYYANYGTETSGRIHDENGKIAFDNNDQIKLYKGTEFTAPTNSEGVKAVFDSWNTKRNGSGKSFAGGQEVRINKLGSENGKNELYAQWKYVADLTISNTVTGNQGDKTKYFEFKVVINNVKENTSYSLDKTYATNENNPDQVKSVKGKIETTVYLKDGESIIFKDVNITNKKVTYQVTETDQTDYTTTYNIDDGNNTIATSTQTEDFGKNHKVAFTNIMNGSIPTGVESNSIITLPLIIAGIGFVLYILRKKNTVG